MVVWCYILKDVTGQTYTGITKSINRRYSEHIKGMCKSTKHLIAPNVVWFAPYTGYVEARKVERYIKGIGARKFLNSTTALK